MSQLFLFGRLNETEIMALEAIEHRLLSSMVVTPLRPERLHTLDVNACDKPIGGDLLQEQTKGTAKPVAYWSYLLYNAEQAKNTTQKECMSIVWTVLLLKRYLKQSCYTIQAGRDVLHWMFNMSDAARKLAIWFSRLSEVSLEIFYGMASDSRLQTKYLAFLRLKCTNLPFMTVYRN